MPKPILEDIALRNNSEFDDNIDDTIEFINQTTQYHAESNDSVDEQTMGSVNIISGGSPNSLVYTNGTSTNLVSTNSLQAFSDGGTSFSRPMNYHNKDQVQQDFDLHGRDSTQYDIIDTTSPMGQALRSDNGLATTNYVNQIWGIFDEGTAVELVSGSLEQTELALSALPNPEVFNTNEELIARLSQSRVGLRKLGPIGSNLFNINTSRQTGTSNPYPQVPSYRLTLTRPVGFGTPQNYVNRGRRQLTLKDFNPNKDYNCKMMFKIPPIPFPATGVRDPKSYYPYFGFNGRDILDLIPGHPTLHAGDPVTGRVTWEPVPITFVYIAPEEEIIITDRDNGSTTVITVDFTPQQPGESDQEFNDRTQAESDRVRNQFNRARDRGDEIEIGISTGSGNSGSDGGVSGGQSGASGEGGATGEQAQFQSRFGIAWVAWKMVSITTSSVYLGDQRVTLPFSNQFTGTYVLQVNYVAGRREADIIMNLISPNSYSGNYYDLINQTANHSAVFASARKTVQVPDTGFITPTIGNIDLIHIDYNSGSPTHRNSI